MSLFSDLSSDDNSHWVSASKGGSGNAGGGSTSPLAGSAPPGFDPTVARPSAAISPGSSVGSDAPPSQFGLLNTTRYQSPTGPGLTISRDDQFHCKVCNVSLSGFEPAKQHYAGKQHRKAVNAKEAGQTAGDGATLPLECKVCQKPFTGQASARQHYASSKHKTAMEGAAFWARNQGQGGAIPDGARSQRSPIGVTALGSAAQEAFNIPTSQGPGGHHRSTFGVLSNAPAADGVSSQQLYHRSTPGALPNLGASGGSLEQPASEVSPDNELLRRHIAKVCSSVLQRYMMQLIPDLTDKITDVVLEELSKTTPVGVSGREAAARAAPRQNGSAEELLQSSSTDFKSMPSLMDAMSLNSLDSREAGNVSARNNLGRESTNKYNQVWNTLTDNNK